jgi:hypothetical protein
LRRAATPPPRPPDRLADLHRLPPLLGQDGVEGRRADVLENDEEADRGQGGEEAALRRGSCFFRR